MKLRCPHTNTELIVDENYNESLPVKRVLICTDCNTEIINEHLMLQTDNGKDWKRNEELKHIHELEMIKKEPLYIRKI